MLPVEIGKTTAHIPAFSGRWGQDRRLQLIEYRLRWAGRLNRSDLTAFFGISVPQASLDLAEYGRRAPGNLAYDKKTRSYILGDIFEPIFPATNHERYLADLLRESTQMPSHFDSFLGWHPPIASTPVPGRTLSGELVATIVRAIRENEVLAVVYQSFSRPEPTTRRVTPHALVHDGQRWHVRAYCHLNDDFRDFVISRILRVEGHEPDRPRGLEDHQWHNIVRLKLAPHPDATDAQRKATELEYAMVDGACEFECREALLFYVLHELRLDAKSDASAREQHIVLVNRDELEPLLQRPFAR